MVTLMLVIASGCGGSSEDDETSVEESTAERTSEATTKETTTKERTAKEKASKDKTRKDKAPKDKAAKEKKAAKQKTKESKTTKASSSQQNGGVVSSSSSTRSTETSSSDTLESANVDVYSPEVASRDEPVPSTSSENQDSSQEDWRTPSQKAGVNEAGQDVSNTPVISPEENAARLPCLQAYYESLPEDQRGPESQRVTAEANAQGVTPYDIVGC
jgi:flagellar biosynthesis GTPase FlhF